MTTYRICTDATDATDDTIDAVSVDAAAAEFAADEEIRGVRTAAELAAYIERVGGWLEITDEAGAVLAEVQ
jgi:hypothetical protein